MKVKTRKIVAKRFKITPTGKILRRRQGLRHIKSTKSKTQKKRLKRITHVHSHMTTTIKKLMPYAS